MQYFSQLVKGINIKKLLREVVGGGIGKVQGNACKLLHICNSLHAFAICRVKGITNIEKSCIIYRTNYFKRRNMDPHYRVAIFGSARIKEHDDAYNDVYAIARGMAESGFDVVTGGGPGIMQAANAGHKSVPTDAHSVGLNVTLPFEQEANKYLDIKKEFDRFSGRLDAFMSLSDAIIVATGGIGTLLDLFYSWQLIQVQHICETPIILFGEMWGGLVGWMREEVLSRGLFDKNDLHNIIHIRNVEKVISFVRQVHEDRLKMEHVCVNYNKYRVEFG